MPIGVPKKMPVDHNGSIFIRVLRFSTSSTIHSFHDLAVWPLPSVFSAASFKNLRFGNVLSGIHLMIRN